MTPSVPTEEEWLASMAKARERAEKGVTIQSHEYPNPTHPVHQLQGPFDESIFESVQKCDQDLLPDLDGHARRKRLLESETYERTVSGKWAQRPEEKYHPLWKLVAQLSFGMHLLVKGLAKSELEVMKILQSHVDELDGFLRRTTEDLDLAHSDIRERIRLLRVPLEHQRVFDSMLEERRFRSLIIDGNDRIEHVIERSALSMHDTLKDIRKALDAVGSLGRCLKHLGKSWAHRPQNLEAVFNAMIGNVDGWERALSSLQVRGNDLGVSLIQLGAAASEMQRRVGIASRKNVVGRPSLEKSATPSNEQQVSVPPYQGDVSKSDLFKNSSFTKSARQSSTPQQLMDSKPLPEAPDVRSSIHEALSKPPGAGSNSLRQSTPNPQGSAQVQNYNRRHRQTRSPPHAGIITRPQSISGPPGSVELPARKPKAVAWEITIPEKLPEPSAIGHRPSSAPGERQHLRSRSCGQGDPGQAGKSTTLKNILETFLQSERKKPLASGGKPDQTPRKLNNQRSSSKLKMPFPGLGQNAGDSRPRRQSVSDARQSALNLFRARSTDDLRNFMSPGPSNKTTPGTSPANPKSDQQFMWSDSQTNVSSTYVLKPSSGSSSPRLPQPVPPYHKPTKESLAEVDEDKADAESVITALPSIGSLSPKTVEERASGKGSGYNSPKPLPTIPDATPPRHSSRNASQHVNAKRATSSNSAGQHASGSSRSMPRSNNNMNKSSLPLRDSNPKARTPLSSAPDGSPLVRPRNRKNSSLRIHVTDSTPPKSNSKYGSSLAPEASLVEHLASTPPASPIHDRTPPVSGDNPGYPSRSNKLNQSHSSRSRLGLGVKIGFNVDPDLGSPPPPGPGGRSMVTPDYGAQSAFEGEKQVKTKRAISVGQILASRERSLRRFFGSFVGRGGGGGGAAADPDRDNATSSPPGDGQRSQSVSKDRVPVGQPFKREVSCFHGVGKDGTWVANERSR